jgi:hypothetical protein
MASGHAEPTATMGGSQASETDAAWDRGSSRSGGGFGSAPCPLRSAEDLRQLEGSNSPKLPGATLSILREISHSSPGVESFRLHRVTTRYIGPPRVRRSVPRYGPFNPARV